MVKSSPGVTPKPRFGPILDSTALTGRATVSLYVLKTYYVTRLQVMLRSPEVAFSVTPVRVNPSLLFFCHRLHNQLQVM